MRAHLRDSIVRLGRRRGAILVRETRSVILIEVDRARAIAGMVEQRDQRANAALVRHNVVRALSPRERSRRIVRVARRGAQRPCTGGGGASTQVALANQPLLE